MEMKNIKIGVIADDFTGAGDAASFLEKSGAETIMYNAVPNELQHVCDAAVIALKTRSVTPHEAVAEAKKAVDFLKENGCERIYYKYCSTFDSTPQGNIGVVADFLLDYLAQPFTILCPSLPVNQRIVKDGILYVNGEKLSDSPLKNHPLNPMWDSYIPNLMKPQSKYPCFIMRQKELCEWRQRINVLKCRYEKFYIVPDYETEQDGKQIAEVFKDLPILTGGSGLLAYVLQSDALLHSKKNQPQRHGRTILLCGSCSAATRCQIAYYREHHGSCYPVNANRVMNKELTAQDILNYANKQEQPVLIYSDAVEQDMQELKKDEAFYQASECIEQIMGEISRAALSCGYERIVVAGGETSGAVIQQLGFDGFYIGKSVDPGVPELIPLKNEHLTLVLKSGNFGAEDFFIKAIGGNTHE
ncbi:four-carbon acid sugar kinase family protein [[Clostridium] innocuum]|nr:four-carbon acid sugar kinase family protein [[Clostridium] innocuum]